MTKAQSKTPPRKHLRFGATDAGGMVLICLHCGTLELPTMPISFDNFDKASRSFMQTHTNCPCPDSGPHNNLKLLIKARLRKQ